MVMTPNWFDMKYSTISSSATADVWLRGLASDEVILAAVQKALDDFKANASKPGPSISQAVRMAIVNTLNS